MVNPGASIHKFYENMRGILQGGTLGAILFVLAGNPLSFLLNECEGYLIGEDHRLQITQLFSVDDLKL